MESVSEKSDIANVKENAILFADASANFRMNRSQIHFAGRNNILFIDGNVVLEDADIRFNGSNALVYLSSSRHTYSICVVVYHNSVLYFGHHNYINPYSRAKMLLILSEGKHIIIGNDCVFSTGIVFRNSDVHLIYECNTKKRINLSKSIYIGDHVWLSQNTTILKGARIGSGSIVGASAVVANTYIPCNVACAGGNIIRENVFFTGDSNHAYTHKETKEKLYCRSEKYIYKGRDDEKRFHAIEEALNGMDSAEDRLAWIRSGGISDSLKPDTTARSAGDTMVRGGFWLIGRKIQGGIQCYKDHGLHYTVKRTLYHLGLKK